MLSELVIGLTYGVTGVRVPPLFGGGGTMVYYPQFLGV